MAPPARPELQRRSLPLRRGTGHVRSDERQHLVARCRVIALKWYEVTKSLVDVNHGPVAGTLVVSKTWDKLSSERRAMLTKLGEELTQRGMEIGRRTTQEGIDRNKEKGMELIPASKEMAAAAKEVTTKIVIPSWAKRTGPGA
jgi:TRAP-type C4-dicarboxylate transport system substrate-binding protein